jgi:hypothetical protein
MYSGPHEPETGARPASRDGHDDEDSPSGMRTSSDDDEGRRQDEPLDEPGYGHGV